jgi:hypothetical protein
MVYVIQICWQLASRIRIERSWSCSKAVNKPVWHIPLLCVQWITPDDGQRNCPKHVELHFKNKFEKLVHLVGLIIRKFVTMHGHTNVKNKEEYLWPCRYIRSIVTPSAIMIHVGSEGCHVRTSETSRKYVKLRLQKFAHLKRFHIVTPWSRVLLEKLTVCS